MYHEPLTIPVTPAFLKAANVAPASDGIKNILMVGALVDRTKPYNEEMLSPQDRQYLQTILEMCAQNNVAVSPAVKIRTLNLYESEQQDFLDPAKIWSTEMLVFSYVYYCLTENAAHQVTNDIIHRCSKHSHCIENWVKATERAGSKLIFNVRSGLDVPKRSEPPVEYIASKLGYSLAGRAYVPSVSRKVEMFSRLNAAKFILPTMHSTLTPTVAAL